MRIRTVKLITITDLDGTLLHPKNYSFDAALPALKLIKEKDMGLILCSSKTRAEIEVYRRRLDNRHPFISENGGGIFIPKKYFSSSDGKGYDNIVLGKPYQEIRKLFLNIRQNLHINVRGFGDMDAKEVAVLTDMSLSEAELAKKREFDEPFIFEKGETRIHEFLKAIEDAGFHWTQGRFYHIIGDNDKGKAVKMLKGFYEKIYGSIKTIGLGDNFNDLTMLQQVDYPVLVQKQDASYDDRINLPGIIKADGIGPEGWNKAVIGLVREIMDYKA